MSSAEEPAYTEAEWVSWTQQQKQNEHSNQQAQQAAQPPPAAAVPPWYTGAMGRSIDSMATRSTGQVDSMIRHFSNSPSLESGAWQQQRRIGGIHSIGMKEKTVEIPTERLVVSNTSKNQQRKHTKKNMLNGNNEEERIREAMAKEAEKYPKPANVNACTSDPDEMQKLLIMAWADHNVPDKPWGSPYWSCW